MHFPWMKKLILDYALVCARAYMHACTHRHTHIHTHHVRTHHIHVHADIHPGVIRKNNWKPSVIRY